MKRAIEICVFRVLWKLRNSKNKSVKIVVGHPISDVEIVVYPGSLARRKFLSWQKILRAIYRTLSRNFKSLLSRSLNRISESFNSQFFCRICVSELISLKRKTFCSIFYILQNNFCSYLD